jgi:hypothetical protein
MTKRHALLALLSIGSLAGFAVYAVNAYGNGSGGLLIGMLLLVIVLIATNE